MSKLFTYLFLLSFFFSPSLEAKKVKKYKYQLSIMSLFQNEADYLKEWIEYHLLLGVDHFYLYNHNSTDHFLEVLTPYIEKGVVECIDYSQPGYPQNCAIKHALAKAKDISKWLAFIDIDEFFLPKHGRNLLQFLRYYEKYAGLTVNWQCFGTSNIPYIPPGELMLEHLTFKALSDCDWNTHVKCIVRPERVKDVVNTHCFTYHHPFYAVRPNRTFQQHSHKSSVQTDLIVLNHYWTRDEKFFNEIKVPRCIEVKGWTQEQTENVAQWMNQVEDRFLIEKYAEELKERM